MLPHAPYGVVVSHTTEARSAAASGGCHSTRNRTNIGDVLRAEPHADAHVLIDSFPQVVGGRCSLHDAFVDEGLARNLPVMVAEELFHLLPPKLRDAWCFLDLLSGRWLYEFGSPFTIGPQLLFGPHVWHPVENLVAVVVCAARRLPPQQFGKVMLKLDNSDAGKHEATLAEFVPVLRLRADVIAEFEILTGARNCDVDWRITPTKGRAVLLEVKRRTGDLTLLGTRIVAGERSPSGHSPQPTHDPELLFRSVAKKFLPGSPDDRLQGVWVVTSLKQEEQALQAAFHALDRERVHFAVLGGWSPGVRLLARRAVDHAALLELFEEREKPGAYAFVTGR